MDKERYIKLAEDLEDIREFLEDCDDNLDFEVAAKDDIGKRIFQAEKEIAQLKYKAQAAGR